MMKSWKSKWKSQLDGIIPEFNDEVKNYPLAESNVENDNRSLFERFNAWVRAHKRRFFGGVATFIACVLALCFILPSVFNAGSEFAVVLEVNPKVALSTDKKGKVVSVIALNCDADVILSDEERTQEMLGEKVENAASVFIDYAAKLGYLDLSEQSAVKVSGFGNDKLLDCVTTSLEKYFCNKGGYFAVVKETLDKRSFCSQIGIESTESATATIKKLKSFNKLYSKRENGSVSELYASVVTENEVYESLKQYLNDYYDLLIDINKLNESIINHKDNPAKLTTGSYWILNSIYSKNITGELKILYEEMTEKLDLCESKYGKCLDSTFDLGVAIDFAKLKKDVVNSKFVENIVTFVQELKSNGLNLSIIENLAEIPNSIEEYISKINDYYSARIDRFIKAYQVDRQKIENADYTAYKNGLIEKYGSLNAYWNYLKNI